MWPWKLLGWTSAFFSLILAYSLIVADVSRTLGLLHTTRFWTLAPPLSFLVALIYLPRSSLERLQTCRRRHRLREIPTPLLLAASYGSLAVAIGNIPKLLVDPIPRAEVLPPRWAKTAGVVTGPGEPCCDDQNEKWCPQLRYRYTVDGQDYSSNQVSTHCFSMEKNVRDFLRALPSSNQGKVVVFYDPQDPGYSWLLLVGDPEDSERAFRFLFYLIAGAFTVELYSLLLVAGQLRTERRSLGRNPAP
jgi:hypothetical protein